MNSVASLCETIGHHQSKETLKEILKDQLNQFNYPQDASEEILEDFEKKLEFTIW